MDAADEAGEADLVEVAAVYSRPELCVLLTALRNYGIMAATVGEGHARVDWRLMVALGGVRIRVPRRDVPLAAAILHEVDRTPSRRPVYAPQRVIDLAMMLLLTLFFMVPPPARMPAQILIEVRREAA